MSQAALELQAERAAQNLLRGPMPGPNYFIEMARGWDFPPDRAVARPGSRLSRCLP